MKKILSTLTLATALMVTSLVVAPLVSAPCLASDSITGGNDIGILGNNYNKICRTVDSSYNSWEQLYHTKIVDEDGESWIVFSNDRIPVGSWLDVEFNNNNTPDPKDDAVLYFNYLDSQK